MVDQIEQLKTAQRNLTELRKIREQQKYIGCGLYLTIGCGPNDVTSIETAFGCSINDLDSLVGTLIDHQTGLVNYWRRSLTESISKAKALLAD